MNITRITVARSFNLGNYNNIKIEVELTSDDNEKIEWVSGLNQLTERLHEKINEAKNKIVNKEK